MSDYLPHLTMYTPKDGEKGSFSKFVVGGYDVISTATPSVMEALKGIPTLASKEVFTVADYGTADGGTSMALMHRVIRSLKEKYGNDQEVMIYYEDQPGNDYNSLFLRIYGNKKRMESFLHSFSHVYATVSGCSFYKKCFPDESIHLGLCFTAVHWLRTGSFQLQDALIHVHSKNKQVLECFENESKENWEMFLLNREKELKSGGHMIITCLGILSNGIHSFWGHKQYHCLYKELEHVWKMLADKKIIRKDEYERATFNFYFQREDEVKAPFLDKNSEVHKSGLTLVSVTSQISPCRLHAEFVHSYIEGDSESARQYANKVVLTMRAFSNSTFIAALNDERSMDEKNKITDQLYLDLKDQIVKCPTRYAQDIVYYIVHVKKA